MMTRLRIYLTLRVWTGCFLTACAETSPLPSTPTAVSRLHLLDQEPTASAAAVSAAAAQPVWATQLSDAVNVTPVVSGELIVVATVDGQIHAVEVATGAMVWRFTPDERLWDASLRVVDSRICAGLQGGLVTCLDAETGEPLWMTELGQEMQSRPALVEGKLYVPTTHVGAGLENNYNGQASLFVLDVGTGKVVWEAVTGNYILRRPIVDGDLVITGGTYENADDNGDGSPNRIYALDKMTGEERWVHESEDGLIHWLAAANEVIAFSGNSEIVRALDPDSGELVWSFGPSYWMQFPAVADDMIFLGTGDERFFALDAASGELLWEQSIDLDSLNQIGRPPIRKMEMAPSTKSIGVWKLNFPPHRVPTQLKNFIPVGTATNMVAKEKGMRKNGSMPDVNIWCAHTRKPTKAMAMLERATHL
jgi:outer membrane protein assembly factor BamB